MSVHYTKITNLYTVRNVSMLNSRRGPPSPSAFASSILDLSQIDSYAHLVSLTTMQSFVDLFIIDRSGTSDLERAAYMGLTPRLESASALSLHHTHPPKSAATTLPYCVMFRHIKTNFFSASLRKLFGYC